MNPLDNPAVIERVIELMSRHHHAVNIRNRFYHRRTQPNSNIFIARQSPTQGIIYTLMSRAGDRILADQAEWWYSTDLTNLDQ